jgi:hypothetical protein
MRELILACAVMVSMLPIAHEDVLRVLRLTFAGDIMGHDVNYQMQDFQDIYRGLRDILLARGKTINDPQLPPVPAFATSSNT